MTDIELIDINKSANNISIVCTTLQTATYIPSRLVRENTDSSLSIDNIEEKYDELFDDITYYTLGNTTIIGA